MWYLRNVSQTRLQDKEHESVTAIQNSLLDKRSVKLMTGHVVFASHKSNPLSVSRGIVDSCSTLPWVMWEAVTVVGGIPRWGLL